MMVLDKSENGARGARGVKSLWLTRLIWQCPRCAIIPNIFPKMSLHPSGELSRHRVFTVAHPVTFWDGLCLSINCQIRRTQNREPEKTCVIFGRSTRRFLSLLNLAWNIKLRGTWRIFCLRSFSSSLSYCSGAYIRPEFAIKPVDGINYYLVVYYITSNVDSKSIALSHDEDYMACAKEFAMIKETVMSKLQWMRWFLENLVGDMEDVIVYY